MLKDALARIPEGLPAHLSTSVPWSLYWCSHALDVLGERAWLRKAENKHRVLRTLRSCWNEADGGFGGGPGLGAHACATYAAVCTLVILGERQLPSWLDRQLLLYFLGRLKHGDRFHSTLHERVDDVRITYCALAAASLVAGDDDDCCRRLAAGCDAFLDKLQSYEGGLSGTPHGEAHAGYTYCALAAAILAGRPEIYDTRKLLSWLATRQTSIGGLQGRINKLPDTCYTFWLGGTLAMLSTTSRGVQLPYDVATLVKFVLACQSPDGGFSDHPLEKPDLYHTCYAISGLATIAELLQRNAASFDGQSLLLSDTRLSKLARLDPVYNICQSTVREWRDQAHNS
jgi:protein farnesyltransferase subunit beta